MTHRRDILAGGLGLTTLTAMGVSPAMAQDKKPILVKLPFDYSPSGFVIIGLTIDGKGPFRFLLDSGAFGTCIREDIARQLNLRSSGTIRTHSVKGHEDSYIYAGNNCVLGGIMPLKRMTFIGLAKFAIAGIDGILPASFLTFLPTQLDFEAMELRYYINGAPMDMTGFQKIPALIEADITDSKTAAKKIFVDASLGGKPIKCKIDTGASTQLFLFPQYVEKQKLWDSFAAYDDGQGGGANGERFNTRVAIANNFALGPFSYAQMRISMADPRIMDSSTGNLVDGLIGIRMMKQFTLAVTAQQEVWLKPNKTFTPDTVQPLMHSGVAKP